MATSKALWDQEYSAGRWDFLAGLPQQSKSGLIAAWLREAGALDDVLDVGCGEGLLHAYLTPYGMSAYTGVDISEVAIARARERLGDVPLHIAPLEDFAPAAGAAHSAIIFNEVLVFVDDPAAEIARYAKALRPGGVVVVSNYAPYDRPDSGALPLIEAISVHLNGPGYTLLDAVTLKSNKKGSTFELLMARVAG